MRPRLLLVLAGVAPLARPGWAGECALAVSPGSPSGSLIGDTCPTFSWGAFAGAKSYELVVYRLGDQGEEAEPLLTQHIAGSALAWTPSLDRCLERGGRYAWTVRAAGKEETSDWSSPSFFQVASGPSAREGGFSVRSGGVMRHWKTACPKKQAAPGTIR